MEATETTELTEATEVTDTTNVIYDFFISHSKEEDKEAKLLYDMLKEVDSDWNIFYDKESLRDKPEWQDTMFRAVANSKHLIFLAKSCETLSGGWVREEVNEFYKGQTKRLKYGDNNLTISYFGIIYDSYENIEEKLFSDPEFGPGHRARYDKSNNIYLEKNDSIVDFDATVKTIKGKTMNMSAEDVNHLPALLLDRTDKYASVKAGEDADFEKEHIIDSIIPQLSYIDTTELKKKFLYFDDFLPHVEEKNIAILGNEGGSGKTTIMTKMFFHFLEKAYTQKPGDALIPIYIEASTLAGPDYLIMRNIAKNLYDESLATSFNNNEIGRIVAGLEKEFSRNTEKPNYLLLIDGYNEIPENVRSQFDNEIKEYLNGSRYKNVRVVISGRNIDEGIDDDILPRYNIENLTVENILSYLKKKGLYIKKNSSLLKILSIPMYLTMYVDTSAEDTITKRSDLLNKFVDKQLEKNDKIATNDQLKEQYNFFIKSLFPYLAYRLVTNDTGNSNFEFTFDELIGFVRDALVYFRSPEYNDYIGYDGITNLVVSGIMNINEYSLAVFAEKYFVETAKLLRKSEYNNENGTKILKYQFIHQVYRDFFAAKHIFNDICFASVKKCPCATLSKPMNELDVTYLTVELLREGAPVYDKTTEMYNYDCNTTSRLMDLIENSRQNMQCSDAEFVGNVIQLLKLSRNQNLSGCDFSGLNLTKADFRYAVLSVFDADGCHASSFKNSKINSENLFINNTASKILAACTNEEYIAIFEYNGVLTIWKKGNFNNTPLKIFKNISYKIHKMIFSNDGKKIYGMAGHTILEFPIPEDKFGHKYNIIHKTDTRIRDIFTDDSGEVYFTTVFNSFNPKPISNSTIKDTFPFNAINSASSIRSDKKQIAFGHVLGYSGLKIYDFDEKTKKWIEKKFGIQAILEEFVRKMEKFLKKDKKYWIFCTKKERSEECTPDKYWKYHCAYFEDILLKYNDICEGYDGLPKRIFLEVLDFLAKRNIPRDDFRVYMIELEKEYRAKISDLVKNNRALAYMHGRKFSSVEYKKGTDTLLLTYYNEFGEKKEHASFTTIAEFNTSDLTSKIIHIEGKNRHNTEGAFYSGEDIVIVHPEKLCIVEKNGAFLKYSVIYGINPKFYYIDGMDSFYMVAGDLIYEINKDFVCAKNYRFGESEVVMANGSTPYLVNKKMLKKIISCVPSEDDAEEKNISMINLVTGRRESVSHINEIIESSTVIPDFFGKTIASKKGMISLYDKGTKVHTVPLQQNLRITACDFSGISGSLAELENMDILRFYGAVTDTIDKKSSVETIELDFSYTPSETPFEETEYISNSASPYIFDEDETCSFSTERLPYVSDSKVWSSIQEAIDVRNRFEPSDFSILEWIGWMEVMSPDMVYFLMAADQMEKPSIPGFILRKTSIKNRMNDQLFKGLRLLNKHYNPKTNKPLYTLNKYSKEMMPQITGAIQSAKDAPVHSAFEISNLLMLNLWFSYNLLKLKDHVIAQRHNLPLDLENSPLEARKLPKYLRLDKGAIFPTLIRGALTDEKIQEQIQFVEFLCTLASNYPLINSNGINEEISAAPTIVVIGETLESCKTLNDVFENIAPHIRKIYTYDALILNCTQNDTEDMYIEFIDKKPYKVNISDLVL